MGMPTHALTLTLVLVLSVGTAGAQTAYTAPRTSDGKPDLQGIWDFRTLTPLERPATAGDKARLTPEEAAAAESKAAARSAAQSAPSVRKGTLPVGGAVGAYNDFWLDQGAKVVDDHRTSLITDPPSGRLPPLQPGVRVQVGSASEDTPGERPVRFRTGGIGGDSYEDRGLAERCLLGFNSGPPIIPGGYNQNIQIIQTHDHVVILNEMVHDARIVPLDGRPHFPANIRQWMGDSRGRWDGDTLVIETTNFTDKTASFNASISTAIGTGSTLHLIERFRRVANDTLLYEFTVSDPKTFTQPFTGVLPMKKGEELFEYACHEANYGLTNVLSGARAAEKAPAHGR
jgi:hypothetical protein